jgi:hypothetical protein
MIIRKSSFICHKTVLIPKNGHQKVIFNTTEPHLVENEMNKLFDRTNQQFEYNEIHLSVIIAGE